MCKLPSRKLLATLVAGVLFIPGSGYTLGLGEIEVNSALNQKFNADIELLSATPEDTESIIIKLASRKEFSRAGLDRPYLLNDLRFKADLINGIPHIKVTSGSPIREPFLNFLVEIDWPNGHLLREYTVLLDPPVFMTQSAGRPATVSQTVGGQAAPGSFRPTTTASAGAAPAPNSSMTYMQPQAEARYQQPATSGFAPAPAIQKKTPVNQVTDRYRIKAGDTAWSLANAMRPDQSISPQQMMIALLRANPESFINENINGLKRGYILRMPDYEHIMAISDQEARALVKEQAALWREYLKSQSGGQPVSAMPAGDGESALTETSAGDSSLTGNEAYLEIVSAGQGSSTAGDKDLSEMTAQDLRAELKLSRERVETERVEKEALQQRIYFLEQEAEKRKGMLSVEDEELSRVQSLNEPAMGETADSAAAESAIDTEVTEEAAEEIVAESAGDTEAAVSDVTESADESTVTAAEETPVFEEEVAEEAIFSDELGSQAEQQSENTVAEVTEMAQPVAAAAPPPVQPENRPQADLLTQLLNDPVRLATAGGGLLLVAALIGLVVRRRKASANASAVGSAFEDLDVLADEQTEISDTEENQAVAQVQVEELQDESVTALSRESAAADTAVQEVEAATGAEGDEARDDVIAEADVYLAYGIYQQAEELLTRAISDNPERNDYRAKLAETYYTSKNVDAFVEAASQLKERVDSEDTSEWKKVMVMGQDLCSDNPMFQSDVVEDIAIEDLETEMPAMDFDLGGEESESEAETEVEAKDEADKTLAMDSADEIEFDLSDTGAVEEAEDAKDEFSLDIDTSELDIDINDEAIEDSREEELPERELDAISLDDEDVPADSPDNVIDLPVSEAEQKDDEEIMLDLSDEVEIDSLDMDDTAEADITGVETEALQTSAEEEDFDLSSLDDVDEISTKLDLARAYLDMGDHDGTRGILEEVLADGNDEQKQEASDLMAKLG